MVHLENGIVMTNGLRPRLPDMIACGGIGLFGAAALVIAAGYDFGSLRRMGPGFFPVVTSMFIIVLAAATALETWRGPVAIRAFKWRPIIFISLAILVWTQLVERVGFAPAMAAMIFISSLSKPPFRPISLALMTVFLTCAGWAIFIWGLGMPLTMFGR